MVSQIGHSWQNVVNANGVTITIIGMLIVYFALTFITLVLSSTPRILKIVNKYIPEQEDDPYAKSNGKNGSEAEIVAAISTALSYSMQSAKK